MSFRNEFEYLKAKEATVRRRKALEEEIASLEFLKGVENMTMFERNEIDTNLRHIRNELANLNAAEERQAKAKPNNVIIAKKALPIYVFNDSEIEKFTTRYDKLPDNFKELMDAALFDTVTLGLITQPVFIRGDSKVYNLIFLQHWLGDANEKRHPENQDKTFRKEDIIPCNTLIKAMQILLEHLDGKNNFVSRLTKLAPPQNENRKRLTQQHIALIEKVYLNFEPHRQVLFDCICRDPETKIILDDPVFLPDGYVYERSTAEFYLEHYQGRCPQNENIIFTAEDIVSCCFVINVLDQLKLNAEQLIKAKAAQSEIQKKPIEDESLAALRDIQIESTFILIKKIRKECETNNKDVNTDMINVLEAAMQSLLQLDITVLERAKKDYPRYDAVQTWLAGSQSSASTFGQLYRGIAVKVGTVKKQYGKEVGDHVKAAMGFLKQLEEAQRLKDKCVKNAYY